MKTILVGAMLLCATATPAPAQVLLNYAWTNFDGAPSVAIPDANGAGVSDTRSIVDEAREIIALTLNLEVAGNFNGDLYVTLQHRSGFSVLLNRPGRSPGSVFGYDDRGFNISFNDAAAQGDIHHYRERVAALDESPLTGSWQPDGRLADPAISLTTSPRTAFLNSFQGQSVAGDWTLFAADLSPGGQSQILSWGLQITVVPEPRATMLYAALGLIGLALVRQAMNREINVGKKSQATQSNPTDPWREG